MVKTCEISLKTKGNNDIINITDEISNYVTTSGIKNGIVVVFNPGSTGGITTIEYEPGLIKDIDLFFKKLIPYEAYYHHHNTWHDDNGSSHVRSALLGSSFSIPIINGNLTLGTWQQVVFIDFDTRPRNRRIVCQIVGE